MVADIGLFLGAGASVFLGFPTSNKLINELQIENSVSWNELIKDLGSQDMEEILEYCEKIKTIGPVVSNSKFLQSFRTTRLLDIQGKNQTRSCQLSNLVGEIKSLEQTVVSNLHDQFNSDKIDKDVLTDTFHPLFSFLTKDQDDLDIFTTNYDNVIEYFVRNHGRDFAYYEGLVVEQGLISPKLLLKTHKNSKKNLNIFKLHGSLDWYVDREGKTIKKKTDSTAIGNPVIIPPVLNKNVKDHPLLRAFFDMFEKKIMDYKNFVVIGFSFRDKDIATLIKKRIEANKNTIIISPNCEVNIAKNLFGHPDSESNIFSHICQKLGDDHPSFHPMKSQFNNVTIREIVLELNNYFLEPNAEN